MISAGIWQGKMRNKARVHQSRARRPCFGELVQMDSSPHDWFEGRGARCCLLVLIDDATSQLLNPFLPMCANISEEYWSVPATPLKENFLK